MPQPLSFTTDPIPKLTWRIAVPASVGMFFNTMFNFVDTYCAGLLSTNALAALSLSFPLFFVLVAVSSGLSQGATALLANALGAKQLDDARRIYAQSIALAFVVGVVLTVVGWYAAPELFRLLGASGEYFRTAIAYMRVIIAATVFFVLPMTINGALNAQGETRIYRNFLITGCIANAALNPVLMWGWFGLPTMDVAGIALATVLIQIGGCVWLWRHVSRSELGHGITMNDFRPDYSLMKRIIGQALPASLNMLTIAAGVFVVTWFVQHFGQEAVAATGIAGRIEQMILMPVIGLSTAVLSIVGQNHGAQMPHRVREAWMTNVRFGVALMMAGGAALHLLRGAAMRVFTSDAAVIAKGSDYLSVAAVTLAAYPILFCTVFMMQGLKRPGYGLWVGLYRQIIAPAIVIHLLVFTLGWGLWGVWWGFCLVTWSAALFALWWGRRTLHLQSGMARAGRSQGI